MLTSKLSIILIVFCPPFSVELCKEVMDSLRIYFDFTLPIVLLYNIEKTQFTKLSTSFKPVITNMKREG